MIGETLTIVLLVASLSANLLQATWFFKDGYLQKKRQDDLKYQLRCMTESRDREAKLADLYRDQVKSIRKLLDQD